jgi:hypothetical protein
MKLMDLLRPRQQKPPDVQEHTRITSAEFLKQEEARQLREARELLERIERQLEEEDRGRISHHE